LLDHGTFGIIFGKFKAALEARRITTEWKAKSAEKKEAKEQLAQEAEKQARRAAEETWNTLNRFTDTLFQSGPFSYSASGSQTWNPASSTRAAGSPDQTCVIEDGDFEVYGIGSTGL
jgi:hypothetical protein